MRFLLIGLLLSLFNSCTTPSSPPFKKSTSSPRVTYWVNQHYLSCLESGQSACRCLAQNRYLVGYLNHDSTTFISRSSIHFGHEAEYDYQLIRKNHFNWLGIEKHNPQDSISITLRNQHLYLNDSIVFKPQELPLKSTHDTANIKAILQTQLYCLNASSLLGYKYLSDTTFFSLHQLKNWIKNHQVNIYCSDDFYYDQMSIQHEDTVAHYHLEFKKNEVLIYETAEPRNKGVKFSPKNKRIVRLY